jgi:phage shock protein E
MLASSQFLIYNSPFTIKDMSILSNILSLFTGSGAGLNNTTLSSEELTEKISKGEVYLIDVRSPSEYKGGYIKGASNIDVMSNEFLNKVSKLNKAKHVFVYCQSGMRSGSAASKLRNVGFTHVTNLGGIGSVRKGGLALA